MEFTKIDETTLEVKKPVETVEEVKNYDYDFLKQQEVDILKSKNDFVEARNLELVEVRTLIAECEKLGIKSKVEVELEKELAEEAIEK